MRRVRTIATLRKVFSPVLIRLYALAVFSAVLAMLVSLQNIFQNIPNILEYERFFTYAVVAFTHTELAVQTIVVASALIGVLVLRDIARPLVGLPVAHQA